LVNYVKFDFSNRGLLYAAVFLCVCETLLWAENVFPKSVVFPTKSVQATT